MGAMWWPCWPGARASVLPLRRAMSSIGDVEVGEFLPRHEMYSVMRRDCIGEGIEFPRLLRREPHVDVIADIFLMDRIIGGNSMPSPMQSRRMTEYIS